MGEVPGAGDRDALAQRPPGEPGNVAVLTARPGEAGVDMQVGVKHPASLAAFSVVVRGPDDPAELSAAWPMSCPAGVLSRGRPRRPHLAAGALLSRASLRACLPAAEVRLAARPGGLVQPACPTQGRPPGLPVRAGPGGRETADS